MAFWALVLGVSRAEVHRAVEAVGPDFCPVSRYLLGTRRHSAIYCRLTMTLQGLTVLAVDDFSSMRGIVAAIARELGCERVVEARMARMLCKGSNKVESGS